MNNHVPTKRREPPLTDRELARVLARQLANDPLIKGMRADQQVTEWGKRTIALLKLPETQALFTEKQ